MTTLRRLLTLLRRALTALLTWLSPERAVTRFANQTGGDE